MTRLAGDLLAHLIGTGVSSYLVWALVTAGLIVVGIPLVALGERIVGPIAMEAITRPGRVALTMLAAGIAIPLTFVVMVASVVLIPLAIIELMLVPAAAIIGVIALVTVVTDRATRAQGFAVHPLIAMTLGILAFRVIRIVPYVGGVVSALIWWYALAATVYVGVLATRSWWLRRLPDEEQFPEENTIEWNQTSFHETPNPHQDDA